MKTTGWTSLLFVLLLSVAPVLADKKAPISDGGIHDQVMIKLAGDQEVRGGAIDVEVANGVVTLKGRVGTDRTKQKAEHLTKKVKGVVSVNNQLTVGPPK